MPALTRVLGAATAAYSAAIIVWPKVLASPCGLTTATGKVRPEIRVLIGAIGARDTAIGVAMVCAPKGPALKAALAARVTADAADAVLFGTQLPERKARAKVAAFATGWAVLCALSAFAP
ncbi:hypothetical protein [Lentzea sp. NEAU-D7]|uniref:hypothetical protein n=1 Tax=Lentzea sp. NEAU-D7 TaxID=2994667 RepID=UPI00224ACC35|nr:hypothetical protein [Lentzea sp. NEAU-D7]MCX2952778.1 hypothetical protein [Lentzea sp. NEAU-D7]